MSVDREAIGWQKDGTYVPCPECLWVPVKPRRPMIGTPIGRRGTTHYGDCSTVSNLTPPPQRESSVDREAIRTRWAGDVKPVVPGCTCFSCVAQTDIAALLAALEEATVEFNAWEEERDRADAEEDRAVKAEAALEEAEAQRDLHKGRAAQWLSRNVALRARLEEAEARIEKLERHRGIIHAPTGSSTVTIDLTDDALRARLDTAKDIMRDWLDGDSPVLYTRAFLADGSAEQQQNHHDDDEQQD